MGGVCLLLDLGTLPSRIRIATDLEGRHSLRFEHMVPTHGKVVSIGLLHVKSTGLRTHRPLTAFAARSTTSGGWVRVAPPSWDAGTVVLIHLREKRSMVHHVSQ